MLNTPAKFAAALNLFTLFRTPLSGLQPTQFGHELALFPLVQLDVQTSPAYGAPFVTVTSQMIETISRRSQIVDTISRRSEIDENE